MGCRMPGARMPSQNALTCSNWPPWAARLQMVIVYLAVAAHLSGTLTACPPAPCSCANSTSQVMCHNTGFTDIPRNLPPSTSTLDLSNNEIHTLSASSLATLRSVVNLKLKHNKIETIHDGAFEAMMSLQTLDLSGNMLTRLSEYSLEGAAQTLLHLDISVNQLQEIDGAFSEMAELSRLDLQNNSITEITQFTFRDLKSLRYLLLADNRISTIDRKAFKNLEKLMYLVLKGNPVGDVARFQFDSYFLSYVDMSECGLTTVPRGLPNSIRYLQLRRNNMTEIKRHTFQDCPYISILVLDENGITNIHDNTFQYMTYLQQLWLNNNHLRKIPHPLPSSLQRLLMDSNQVEYLNGVFPSNSELNTLSLMGNNISYLSYNAFYKLSKLQSIDLSNNKLGHIYGNTFFNNTHVETLQLSKNPLRFFHSRCFHGLTALKTLSLAYIPTTVSMHSDIFRDFTNITKLDLDSSHWIIRTILANDQLLSSLGHVQDLSMVSSDLTHLRSDFPSFFPQLAMLHISSTRWHCDTSMIWFRNWLLSTKVVIEHKDDIICYTPVDVHVKSIITLTDYDFAPATTPKSITALPTAGQLSTFPTQPSTLSTLPPTTPTTSQTDPDQGLNPKDTEPTLPVGKVDSGSHNGGNQGRFSSRRPPTWDEVLSMSSMIPLETLLESFTPPYGDSENYDPGGMQNDDKLDIHTLPPGGRRTNQPPTAQTNTHSGMSNTTMIIIIATTIATIIIAAVLIFVIVYLIRKQKQKPKHAKSRKPKPKKNGEIYQNGIKYKNNKNDVLYFMPKSTDGSTTDSLKTTNSKEAMSLIPGRDINHEGPLRVYKWEDF